MTLHKIRITWKYKASLNDLSLNDAFKVDKSFLRYQQHEPEKVDFLKKSIYHYLETMIQEGLCIQHLHSSCIFTYVSKFPSLKT